MAKLDPVTGEIVTILTLSKEAMKVTSIKNKWYALKIFTDVEDAIEWRAAFDLAAAAATAKEDKDEKSGMFRLVGTDWATEFMTESDLELWKADVAATMPKPKARAKAKPKAKQEPATDATTKDSE